jgi:thiamine-phosphate pyrophosphorylase
LQNALNRRILCYVTNGTDFPGSTRHPDLVARITAALEAGVDWIQIREKQLSPKALLALAREAGQVAQSQQRAAQIIMNDRLDVALAAPSSGVHLGNPSLSCAVVAGWLKNRGPKEDFSIGVSCHSLQDALRAESAGADYIFFGPVFDTPSKRAFGAPQGLEALANARAAIKIPLLAIGGVNQENAFDCLHAGASGIAAIRLFQESPSAARLADFVSRVHAFNC